MLIDVLIMAMKLATESSKIFQIEIGMNMYENSVPLMLQTHKIHWE